MTTVPPSLLISPASPASQNHTKQEHKDGNNRKRERERRQRNTNERKLKKQLAMWLNIFSLTVGSSIPPPKNWKQHPPIQWRKKEKGGTGFPCSLPQSLSFSLIFFSSIHSSICSTNDLSAHLPSTAKFQQQIKLFQCSMFTRSFWRKALSPPHHGPYEDRGGACLHVFAGNKGKERALEKRKS